jgi:hypothetical protein
MSSIERSIVIEKPINDVWDFVQDTANDALWQTTLIESRPLTAGPKRVGTQVHEIRRFMGLRLEMEVELTEFEPNRKSSVKTVSGGIPLSGSYVLEPLDGGTKLTMTGELDAHRTFKPAQPVFASITSRELEASLGNLKDLLEVA